MIIDLAGVVILKEIIQIFTIFTSAEEVRLSVSLSVRRINKVVNVFVTAANGQGPVDDSPSSFLMF